MPLINFFGLSNRQTKSVLQEWLHFFAKRAGCDSSLAAGTAADLGTPCICAGLSSKVCLNAAPSPKAQPLILHKKLICVTGFGRASEIIR